MNYALIDDDKLIQLSWKLKASAKNIPLHCFFTIDDFFKASLPFETNVYVDSSLAGGVLGELEAEKIFLKGYKKIFLATGFNDLNLKSYPWLSGISNKSPPF